MKIIEPSARIVSPKLPANTVMSFLEYCGRICYDSAYKMKLGTAEPFLRMIMKSGHESVLEHYAVTIEAVTDRAISHQLVRHRIAAYSQQSQRYVKYDDLEVIEPLDLTNIDARIAYESAVSHVEASYADLLSLGCKPQTARTVLPNATATRIIMTHNIRSWRHVMRERFVNKRADPEMRRLMALVFKELYEYLPIFFEEFKPDAWPKCQNEMA